MSKNMVQAIADELVARIHNERSLRNRKGRELAIMVRFITTATDLIGEKYGMEEASRIPHKVETHIHQ